MKRRFIIPGLDGKLLIKDAMKEMSDTTRRKFILGGASLGALVMLTGCDLVDRRASERILWKVSKFNDEVQATLFNPHRLAPQFDESAINDPFRFNAFYREARVPIVDPATYQPRMTD